MNSYRTPIGFTVVFTTRNPAKTYRPRRTTVKGHACFAWRDIYLTVPGDRSDLSETVCFPAISRCGEDGKNHSHWNFIFRCLLKPICRLFYWHLVSHRFSCCWTCSSFRWIAFFVWKKTFQYSGVVPACLESSDWFSFSWLIRFFALYIRIW